MNQTLKDANISGRGIEGEVEFSILAQVPPENIVGVYLIDFGAFDRIKKPVFIPNKK